MRRVGGGGQDEAGGGEEDDEGKAGLWEGAEGAAVKQHALCLRGV